jgi:hypothetical protein
MLREKLVTVSGDLVMAKSRVRDLEMGVLDDKKMLKQAAESLLASSTFIAENLPLLDTRITASLPILLLGQQMSDITSSLNKRTQESIDALSCAAEAESRLLIANERCVNGVSIHLGLVPAWSSIGLKT